MVSFETWVAQIKRLEDNYTKGKIRKVYTEQQKELIKGFVRDLNDSQFVVMCSTFIAQLRALPLPKHFEDYSKQVARRSTWNKPPEPVVTQRYTPQCSHCQDTGDCWVLSQKDGVAFETWMNCACSHGERGLAGIPRYEKDCAEIKLQPYPTIFFQPGNWVEGFRALKESKDFARLYWNGGPVAQQAEEDIDFSK